MIVKFRKTWQDAVLVSSVSDDYLDAPMDPILIEQVLLLLPPEKDRQSLQSEM